MVAGVSRISAVLAMAGPFVVIPSDVMHLHCKSSSLSAGTGAGRELRNSARLVHGPVTNERRERTMALVRVLEIENFRVVRALRWLPGPGINCLIGPATAASRRSLTPSTLEAPYRARRSRQSARAGPAQRVVGVGKWDKFGRSRADCACL